MVGTNPNYGSVREHPRNLELSGRSAAVVTSLLWVMNMKKLFLALIVALSAYAIVSRGDDVTTLEYQNAAAPFVEHAIEEMTK